MRIRAIINARALDRAPKSVHGKLLHRVEKIVGNIAGDQLIDAEFTEPLASEFKAWVQAHPEGWKKVPCPKPVPTPQPVDTRPERVPPPVTRDLTAEFNVDLKRHIDQQQAVERLIQYQIEQGLVDDQHNATLILEWLDKDARGYLSAVSIDDAVKALRPSLHFKALSQFTKRLAGF